MEYSTEKLSEQLEEILLRLGALGLLEIEGQRLLRESRELAGTDSRLPGGKIRASLERAVWLQTQRERLEKAGRIIRPVFVRAAVLFFAVFLGAGSVLITSADARNVLYGLLFSEHERYIEIDPTPVIDDSFVDLEQYQAAKAEYGPTYVPEDLVLADVSSVPYVTSALYEMESTGEDYVFLVFSITEMTEGATYRVDSEDAERIEYITIGDSEALLIVKGDFTGVTWYVGNTLLDVYGNIPTEEVIRFARGIRPL